MNNINRELLFDNSLPREVKEAVLNLISVNSTEALNVKEPLILASTNIKWEKDEVSYIRFPKEIENDYRIYWSESNTNKEGKRVILIQATESEFPDIYYLKVLYGKYKEDKTIKFTESVQKLYHKNYITKLINNCN